MNVTLINAACDAHSPVLQQAARNTKLVAACMLTRSAAPTYKQAPVLWDILLSPDFTPPLFS